MFRPICRWHSAIQVPHPLENRDCIPIDSGWWFTYPSEKWWTSSVGMMKLPVYMESHNPAMFQSPPSSWFYASAISHSWPIDDRHPTSQRHLQLGIHLGQHLLTMPSPRVGIAAVDVPGVERRRDRKWVRKSTRSWIPCGKLTVCYWKWPFIVDLPIKHGDFP
jgi:hypothetical protein